MIQTASEILMSEIRAFTILPKNEKERKKATDAAIVAGTTIAQRYITTACVAVDSWAEEPISSSTKEMLCRATD